MNSQNQADQQMVVPGVATVAQRKRPLVAAIGASAGGIEALCSFFAALPGELGVAFVVIIQLPPDQPGEVASVLAACTTMPVIQVTCPVVIKPEQIYVVPANQELVVNDDLLRVTPLTAAHGQRTPIDAFFLALAATYGDGFGIILSGHGTDGAVGIKAIKAGGGLVLVQDPAEAAFDGMPKSAIATGLADLVLPARALAARLVDLTHSKQRLRVDPAQLGAAENATLAEILHYLQQQTGHDFQGYRRDTVLRRVGRRVQLTRTADYATYQHYLRTTPAEVRALFTDLLMPVSTFFRDPATCTVLAQTIIPQLFAGKEATDQVRVWIPGCASGEEAYTVAILLLEHVETLAHRPLLQIFASDLAEQALAIARNGCYPDAIAGDLTPARLQRFFVREGDYYRLKPVVRELLIFSPHNLLRDPPFARLDLIVCRNVLTYLGHDLQQQLLYIFHYALWRKEAAGGYLLLGADEANANNRKLFQPLVAAHGIFQSQQPHGQRLPLLPDLLTEWQQGRSHALPRHGAVLPRSAVQQHRQALEAAAPPSILVDEQLRVVHLSENAGYYLQLPGGAFTNEITRLVRPELQATLTTALQQTLAAGTATFTPPIGVHFDGSLRQIHLLVQPVQPGEEDAPQALVLFIDAGPAAPTPSPSENGLSVSDPHNHHKVEFQDLHIELEQTRAELKASRAEYAASMEQLYSTNEELQTINEEYSSITEELQTSREELQSLNEELQTVNDELMLKLREISQAHSDLQNLMVAAEVGTLFLDQQLRIRRFTPPVTKIFQIKTDDVGRPITDLAHQLNYTALADDARNVMNKLTPHELEIFSADDKWYLLRLRPYRTVNNQIDGVVVTFVDITKHKAAAAALRASEERFRTMADNIVQLAWITDPSGRVSWYNRRWYAYTGATFAEMAGWGWQQLIHPDHSERVINKSRHSFATGEAWEDIFLLRGHNGTYRWFLSHAFPIHDQQGQIVRWFGTNTDVTEQRETEAALRQLNETLEERVAERTAQVRTLASTLTMAEQEERRRIAQILHDQLQQQLYGIQMRVMSMRMDIEEHDYTMLSDYTHEVYGWLSDAIRTTRHLTVDLSPPVLKDEGLVDALHWLATQMAEVNGLQVILEAEHAFPIANEDMRVLLFQIVRELLFNVVKHADTKRATVALRENPGDEIVITVSDAGRGFEPATAEVAHDGGFGLFSVRERLGLFGGRMEIAAAPEQGTQVILYAPLATPRLQRATLPRKR